MEEYFTLNSSDDTFLFLLKEKLKERTKVFYIFPSKEIPLVEIIPTAMKAGDYLLQNKITPFTLLPYYFVTPLLFYHPNLPVKPSYLKENIFYKNHHEKNYAQLSQALLSFEKISSSFDIIHQVKEFHHERSSLKKEISFLKKIAKKDRCLYDN